MTPPMTTKRQEWMSPEPIWGDSGKIQPFWGMSSPCTSHGSLPLTQRTNSKVMSGCWLVKIIHKRSVMRLQFWRQCSSFSGIHKVLCTVNSCPMAKVLVLPNIFKFWRTSGLLFVSAVMTCGLTDVCALEVGEQDPTMFCTRIMHQLINQIWCTDTWNRWPCPCSPIPVQPGPSSFRLLVVQENQETYQRTKIQHNPGASGPGWHHHLKHSHWAICWGHVQTSHPHIFHMLSSPVHCTRCSFEI